MSKEFNPEDFRKAIIKKLPNITCPYCGGNKFSAIDSYIALLAENDLDNLSINKAMQCGAIICNSCGHIDLFALSNYGIKSESGKE